MKSRVVGIRPRNARRWALLLFVPVLVWALTVFTTKSNDPPPRETATLRHPGAKLTVVLLSDTHGRHRELDVPDGDLLVHAGDFTKFGNHRHALDFNEWLGELPHPHKVVVAGNHDGPGTYGGVDVSDDGNGEDVGGGSIGSSLPPVSLSDLPSIITNAHYLEDSEYSFSTLVGRNGRGDRHIVNVWGSPWQPQYPGFETYRSPGTDIARRWAAIPDNTTILVTHTPPAGIMDGGGEGCADLAERIDGLSRTGAGALRLAAFGHFHQHGMVKRGPLTYVNCAVTDDNFAVHKYPRVVTLYL